MTGGGYYDPTTLAILQRYGDLVAVDLSNPTMPALTSALYTNEGQPEGGDMAESGGAILNDGLAYIAGLSPGGSNVANNTGNLLVVNIADPESMSPIRSLSIPGTFELLHVAIDGNRALVIGAAGQENGMIHTDPTGLFNKLSLTLLDISDPDNPQILGSTLVTNDQFPFNEAGYNINVVSLGNGQYALGGIYANGKPSLLVVDAGNSDQLVVSTIPAPSSVHRVTVVGDELYATTASGLSIYHVGQLVPDPVTITVNLPAGGAAQIIPDSYNVAPTQVTTSATGDSLIWNRNFQPGLTSYTFSWQSTVHVAAASNGSDHARCRRRVHDRGDIGDDRFARQVGHCRANHRGDVDRGYRSTRRQGVMYDAVLHEPDGRAGHLR